MIAPHECAPAPGPSAELAARIQAQIPEIETARLRLRAPRIEDFDLYAQIICSPRGTFMKGPMSREDAWDDFARMIVVWLFRGHGAWIIEEKQTAKALGVVLIGFEPGDSAPELGYALSAEAEGRGYASEAAAAIRDHALRDLRLPELVSYIVPENAASIAVAERLGATLAPERVDGILVYRHHLPEARP